jgi:arylsulfatase A-like enzyme
MAGKTHFGPAPSSFDFLLPVSGEKNSVTNDSFAQEMIRRGHSPGSFHPNPVPEEDCLESLIVDKVIESLENLKNSGNPFFAFCSLLSPHSPLDPPGRWLTDDIFKSEIPSPKFRPDEWETLPESLKEFCGLPNPKQNEAKYPYNLQGAQGNVADKLTMEQMRAYRELYYRSSAYMDSLVGRLMDYLETSGLRKNTLVIFTSDHGQMNFDHGFNDKHNYHDESLRVPFIMSLPGILPENEKRGFASHVDITPTILAAAGSRTCEYANGFDLFSPLVRQEESPRNFAAASLYGSLALVTEKWKLELYYLDGQIRLFDRINDPDENNNLANNPGYSDVTGFLCEALLFWRAGLTDTAALKNATGPGGPVAMRVVNRVRAEKSQNNEVILENKLREFAR